MTRYLEFPDQWRGILARDERILWQGAPQNDNPYSNLTLNNLLFGVAAVLVVLTVTLLEMAKTNSLPGALFVLLIGLLVAGVAATWTIGRPLFGAYKVCHSFYTLTTRRAYTGWLLLGYRRLQSWDIYSHTKLELDPGPPGSVYFAEKIYHSKYSSRVEKIGFLNIPDAAVVYELCLKVQKGVA